MCYLLPDLSIGYNKSSGLTKEPEPILLFDMTMATTITQLIVKEGVFPLFHLCSSTHMLKSQPQKTTLRRRGSAVDILLSGLERIAAALHSFGTLPHEPLKPWLL